MGNCTNKPGASSRTYSPTNELRGRTGSYSDDEPIEQDFRKMSENFKKQNYNLEKGLSIEIKTLHKHFQFSSTQDQTIPVMVSVKTLDQTEEAQPEKQKVKDDAPSFNRPSVDLVCVIDNSGSMNGEKIENVKKTLLQLLEFLGENDRLCLILFNSGATRLCNLMKTNKKNNQKIRGIINSISARGGTCINSGMEIAFDVLKQRKFQNPVTSVFLLSDGQDGSAEQSVKDSLQYYLPNECFTIHSFGFGADHDGPMMNKICSLKDGNFYYVEKLDQIDEFFVDALGALFSVVAQEIVIDVQLNLLEQHKKYFKNARVSKTYGEMWNVIKQNETYKIQINQLLSGVSKDFMFEVTIPAIKVNSLEDFERNTEFIKATVSATPIEISHTTRVVKDNNLILTLFTENEKVPVDSEANENVEFNYLRVKASEAMEQAMQQAEQQQYDNCKVILQNVLDRCEKSNPKNSEKLLTIKNDLKECMQNAQPRVYEYQGKHQMLSKKNANMKQQSRATEQCALYSNNVQQKMVQYVQEKKSKY